MKRSLSLLLAAAMFLSIALAAGGCSSNSTQATTNPSTTETGSGTSAGTTNGKSVDLMKVVLAAERPTNPDIPSDKVREAFNRFAAALAKASAENKGNVMISPASVLFALAMTLNGANGETRTAMLQTLANQGITVDLINQASCDWMTLLAKSSEKTSVSIANSIWFDQAFVPDKPFLQVNADFYGAAARKFDFRDPATVGVINAWVKEATKGKIDQIIDQIRADAVMYLINAVYFKSDWLTPFDKNDTHPQIFHAPDSDLQTDFLHRTGKMSWFAGSDATGVTLPYENGQFAFFALLPDGSTTPREWLAKQNEQTLFATIAGMMAQKSNVTVDLAMPKFESRYEDSLKDELSRLGMEIAFAPDRADFSLMNESHEKNLYIGDVKHKTFIRVDEKGTEAAAVTSVEIRTTALPQSDKQLTLDKPFLYGIMDLKTGMPLFVGIMEKPAV